MKRAWLLVCLLGLAGAAEAPSVVPDAALRHDAAVAAAEKAYVEALRSAKAEYADTLRSALQAATRRGDLDTANRVKADLDRVTGELRVAMAKQEGTPIIYLVSARYGRGSKWADVTSAAQARINGTRFELPSPGNWHTALASDPFPGYAKALDLLFRVGGEDLHIIVGDRHPLVIELAGSTGR